MAKKKDTSESPKTDSAGKRRNVVFLTLDDTTEAALEAYRDAQEVPPDRAAVGIKSLRLFLAERGYLKAPR